MNKSRFKRLTGIFLVAFFLVSCTQSIYVEDLTNRLEPARYVEWPGGTATYIYKNDYVYETGYYVFYNKNRVTWYLDRDKTESVSLPFNEVYKLGYRSRLAGAGLGFVGGYAAGILFYNLGILGKTNRPFLSENNKTLSMTTATIFAIGGFTVGFPINSIFKVKENENQRNTRWEVGKP